MCWLRSISSSKWKIAKLDLEAMMAQMTKSLANRKMTKENLNNGGIIQAQMTTHNN
jgi:hypothetical protein